MDDLLLASNVVLWVLVLVLCALVYALARQVGALYRRVLPAGALARNQQLLAGDPAPLVDVETLDGEALVVGDTTISRRSALLFFVDPHCSICKSLLPVLKSTIADEAWLDLILASDGAPGKIHRQLVEAFGLDGYPYVVSEVLGRSYGVGKLPYAVLIDPDGRIVALGVVNSREHLSGLLFAWEEHARSLQAGEQTAPDFHHSGGAPGATSAR